MFNPDDIMKSVKKEFKKIVEDEEIELTCECGHKIRKSIRWLKTNKDFPCPVCGAKIVLLNNNALAEVLKPLD